VDAIAPGPTHDGSSWTDAYNNLQNALGAAVSGQIIEVAQGTYLPSTDADVTASFALQDGVTLMGGFAGNAGIALGISPDARDISLYPTILSGNLPDPSGGIDNSYIVITAAAVDSTVSLDGFVVTGAHNDGLSLYVASPNIEDCTFVDNGGNNHELGGAIYLAAGSSPLIEDCSFDDNTGSDGGAILADSQCDPTLQNCDFVDNVASSGRGGGIFAESSSDFILMGCTFTNNSATTDGGAIFLYDSTISATSTIFLDNSASGQGGAIYAQEADISQTLFANCLFAENSAGEGAAIYNDTYDSETVLNSTFSGNVATTTAGAIYDEYSDPTITNSIVYGDGPDELVGYDSAPSVTYSDVQGGYSGTGNLNVDPIFFNPAAGEFGLTVNSPVRGLGNPSAVPSILMTDLAGNPRMTASDVDMGAYEYDPNNPVPIAVDFETQNVTASSDTADFEGSLGLNWTDLQRGNGSPSGNRIDAVFLSSSPTLTGTAIPLIFQPIAGANGQNIQGQRATVSLPPASAALLPGTYYLVVETDIGDTSGESTLGNNVGASQAVQIQIVPKTIYVDVNSPATAPDGATWVTAYPDLQTALAQAEYGDTIDVAQGTYLPTMDGDQTASFYLKDSISLKGGFAGEEDPDDPAANNSTYVTTLSGDISGDGQDSFTVVTASYVDSTTALQGFTITGATGGDGGGMLIKQSSPAVTNCTFVNNTVDNAGGGMYISGLSSAPVICNCVFSADSAECGGGVFDDSTSTQFDFCTFVDNSADVGGGIYDRFATASIYDCTISYNTAASEGGGAYFYDNSSSPALRNDYVQENSAMNGGGIYGAYSSPVVVNCLFAGNGSSATAGGAIYNVDSFPTIINCTFSVNGDPSTNGGAIFEGDANSGAVVTNSILWGDGGSEIVRSGGAVIASYSDIQGGYAGTANINVDPQFVDAQLGNLELQPTSPCINVGSDAAVPSGVTTDLAGNPRFIDGPVDLGAYECQAPGITWTGLGDGINWSSPRNWSDNLVPTQNDNVTIPSGAAPQLGSGTFATASLTLKGTATLNLDSGTLEIDFGDAADPIATIKSYIQNGYNNDTWTGSGIVSTNAATDPGLYAVGYADGNTDVGTPAAANQIYIKNTLAGDANLDGTVNYADLRVVAQNFNHTLDTHGNAIDWADGDFNYDGKVNFADLLLVAQNFNKQLAAGQAAQTPQTGGSPASAGSATSDPVMEATSATTTDTLATVVAAPSAQAITPDAATSDGTPPEVASETPTSAPANNATPTSVASSPALPAQETLAPPNPVTPVVDVVQATTPPPVGPSKSTVATTVARAHAVVTTAHRHTIVKAPSAAVADTSSLLGVQTKTAKPAKARLVFSTPPLLATDGITNDSLTGEWDLGSSDRGALFADSRRHDLLG
jgi:predicted outer membrane repeat protein/parallel beta-helix repeat protein